MKRNEPTQSSKPFTPGARNFLLSLVIPCYNESARVDIMLQGLADFEEKWKGDYEVIVVDDGSKDDTVQKVANAVATKYTFLKDKLKIEKMPANGGKGSALKRGVGLAKGDYILTLDADMSTKPAELINWEKKEKSLFSGERVIYIGSRKHEEGKVEALKSRKVIGGVFNSVVQIFTTLQLRDTQCGFKLYPREAALFLFENMQSKGWAHDVELLYQADLNGMRIVEMPIYWVNMPESKVNVVKDSMMMLIGVLSISFRIWLYNTLLLPFRLPPDASAGQRAMARGRAIFNILALLLVIVMPVMSFQFAVTGDEHWHFDYGNSIYNYFFHSATDAQTGIPVGAPEGTAPTGIQFYGGIFDFITAFVFNVFHTWDHYTTMHFINAIVGAIGIIYAGKLGKLLGGWGTGILTMVFLILSPSWFGHNFANPKDIPFSAGYTAGIYFMLLFVQSLPRPSARHILGLILSIGWAMGVRIGGFLLIAYLLLFILCYAAYTRQLKTAFSAKVIKNFIIISAAGYLIAIAPWPYAHLGILTKPLESLKIMSNFFVNIPILYDGNRLMSNQVPWYYTPRYMMYTMPLIVMAGSILGLLGIGMLYKKDKKVFVFSLFVLFAVVFPWLYAVYKHSSLYDGWRHFLFIYPPLVAVAAMGWNMLMRSSQKAIKYVAVAAVIGGLLLPAKFVVANHPYESLYYNEIAGGLKGMYGRFETDYYMLGIREATEWLLKNEHLENKKVVIGTNTAYPMIATLYRENRKNLPARYKGAYERTAAFEHDAPYLEFAKSHPDFVDAFSQQPLYVHINNRYTKDWDYYICFSRYLDAAQLKAGAWPPEETIYTVKVDGVPIAAVLKRKTKKDVAGYELMKAKKYGEAKDMYLAALREHPTNEFVWSEMERIYEAEGKMDSAIYACRQALRTNPADMANCQAILSLFMKQQKVDSAVAYFKGIEQYSPSASHFFLGYTYAMAGNANAAFGEIDEAIAADPHNDQPYKLAIELAKQMKDMNRVEEYTARAQKVFPQQEEE